MKIIKKITTFGIICILGICTQSFATSKGIINSETVRLRKEASSDSTILELMSMNEEVEILSEEDGWYKIKYKNITGYANKEYIKETTSEEENSTENKIDNEETNTTQQTQNEIVNNQVDSTQIENTTENVTTNVSDSNDTENLIKEGFDGKLSEEVKLKILPLINSSDIITLQKDTQIKVTEIINDWCSIESNLGLGWIRINTLAKNIQNNEEEKSSNENSNEQDTKQQVVEQEETEKKEEDKTKIGYVNVDTLNVRSKADSESEILTDISKNTQVEILGEEEGWYKIKVKNTTGYVAIKFISDKKVAETTSRGTDKERMPVENQNNAETNKETAYSNNDKTESSSSNTVTGNQIVEYAKQYLGCKYVSGGTSPKTGFDCSGFTYYVYKNFGKTLSRSSKGQINNGRAVQKNELQLGDILVFNDDSNKSIGHVGIYIGGNKFIHAANAKKGVIITSLSDSYYSARYVGARRII